MGGGGRTVQCSWWAGTWRALIPCLSRISSSYVLESYFLALLGIELSLLA